MKVWFSISFRIISILSLYTEGDLVASKARVDREGFQSSPSIQRETPEAGKLHPGDGISILSLYTEGDAEPDTIAVGDKVFQSSPSIQRETEPDTIAVGDKVFQSSPSIQRETELLALIGKNNYDFNPLPLYRGRRRGGCSGCRPRRYFNPLPLYRGRRRSGRPSERPRHFNPLPLYRGRLIEEDNAATLKHFNPLPLYRGRLSVGLMPSIYMAFQSSPSIQRETRQFYKIVYV